MHLRCRNSVTVGHAEQVQKGNRIAQLILEKIMIAEVEEVQELDETVRGEGGIGSTGGFATSS
jgi:dUTPase